MMGQVQKSSGLGAAASYQQPAAEKLSVKPMTVRQLGRVPNFLQEAKQVSEVANLNQTDARRANQFSGKLNNQGYQAHGNALQRPTQVQAANRGKYFKSSDGTNGNDADLQESTVEADTDVQEVIGDLSALLEESNMTAKQKATRVANLSEEMAGLRYQLQDEMDKEHDRRQNQHQSHLANLAESIKQTISGRDALIELQDRGSDPARSLTTDFGSRMGQ